MDQLLGYMDTIYYCMIAVTRQKWHSVFWCKYQHPGQLLISSDILWGLVDGPTFPPPLTNYLYSPKCATLDFLYPIDSFFSPLTVELLRYWETHSYLHTLNSWKIEFNYLGVDLLSQASLPVYSVLQFPLCNSLIYAYVSTIRQQHYV